MQNTAKLNYPASVASYETRPGNEMGLFYKQFSRAQFSSSWQKLADPNDNITI